MLLLLLPLVARAHKESDAYLRLNTDPADRHVLHGQWDIALRDLSFVIDLDRRRDGRIIWGEVKARRQDIEQYALPRLSVRGDGLTCTLQPTGQRIDDHSDGSYDVIDFDAVCDKNIPARLTIGYQLFRDVDPYHRGIVSIRAGQTLVQAVLGPDRDEVAFDLARPDRWQEFLSFAWDGIWHIWTGPDHLLFIASLLLPAVLVRRRDFAAPPGTSVWQPAPRLGGAILELVKVISGFTVSHSATLTLSVLGYVNLPSRLVESGIAFSIIVAAANNIYPLVTRRAWLVAFGFGFIHGLGFASALGGLQLPPLSMATALGGFSLGVELGQEAVVLPLLPLAFWVRRSRFYQVGVLRYGSLCIIALASLWLVQRAFDVEIPGLSFLTPN